MVAHVVYDPFPASFVSSSSSHVPSTCLSFVCFVLFMCAVCRFLIIKVRFCVCVCFSVCSFVLLYLAVSAMVLLLYVASCPCSCCCASRVYSCYIFSFVMCVMVCSASLLHVLRCVWCVVV